MSQHRGLSVRWKLTLSYAGFVMFAGLVLLSVVWLFLLRYVPEGSIPLRSGFVPNRSDLAEAFGPPAAAAIGFLVVFGLAGGWLLAGRMLAPLDRIHSATRTTAGGSLSHRIPLDGADDEFRELAAAFNQMLDRIESHVAEQRRFAANASHELRTPLATTRTLIDVAQSDPSADIPRTLERLRTTNSRAIELTEALLLLSRVEHVVELSDVVDLSLAAEDAEETYVGLAEARGVRIELDVAEARARGSVALLGQLVANLVHNGIVHNLPDGGVVIVTTREADGCAAVVVENPGAQVAPDIVASLVEPFQRGQGRAHSAAHDGAGLGLAIADKIARVHGGILDVRPRPTGGLRVEARFPALP